MREILAQTTVYDVIFNAREYFRSSTVIEIECAVASPAILTVVTSCRLAMVDPVRKLGGAIKIVCNDAEGRAVVSIASGSMDEPYATTLSRGEHEAASYPEFFAAVDALDQSGLHGMMGLLLLRSLLRDDTEWADPRKVRCKMNQRDGEISVRFCDSGKEKFTGVDAVIVDNLIIRIDRYVRGRIQASYSFHYMSVN